MRIKFKILGKCKFTIESLFELSKNQIYICTIYSCFLISRCIRMCVCVCRSDGSFSREEDYTTYRSNGCYANICTVLKHDSVIFIPSIFSVFTIHSRNGIHVHLAQGSIYVGYIGYLSMGVRKGRGFETFENIYDAYEYEFSNIFPIT